MSQTNQVTTKSTSAVPLQAGLVLAAGAAAAAFFGGGEPAPQPKPSAAQPTLVRRAAPPVAQPEAPVTQLLGYVDDAANRRAANDRAAAPGGALATIGISARPEPRTAAQVAPAAPLSQLDAPPALHPTPVLTAAATSGPWAKMQPYAANGASGTDEASRPGLTSTPTNAARKHVVRDGDTLGGLAEKYYGDARRYKELFAANRGVLSNPELLPIGATLQIPSFDPTAIRTDAPTGARLVPQVLIRNP